MKNLLILMLLIFMSSCATTGMLAEDELFQTRKYVGNYVESENLGREHFGNAPLVLVVTTMRDVYGSIYIYSKDCKFVQGNRIYIRREYLYAGALTSYWQYRLESDNGRISYRLRQFRFDNKLLVQTWF